MSSPMSVHVMVSWLRYSVRFMVLSSGGCGEISPATLVNIL